MTALQTNLPKPIIDKDNSSIKYWANLYFNIIVSGSAAKTIKAKHNDLSKFISFFIDSLKNSNADYWTPSVSKHFQKTLVDSSLCDDMVNYT